MKRRAIYGSAALVVLVVAVGVLMSTHATTTNLFFPTLSTCTNVGSQITVNLQANSVTGVNAWQVNVTFTAYALGLKSVSLGSSWTSGGHSYFATTLNNSGTYQYAFTYENNATLTKSTAFTFLSFVFTVLQKPVIGNFHIVTASENVQMGTYVLGQSLVIETYTTTDGEFDNCLNRPGH